MATLNVPRLGGIDTRNPQSISACTELTNWTWDQRNNGWDNRIGYERYFEQSTSSWAPFTGYGRIDSLHIWNTHGGARNFIFFETGGELFMVSEWGDSFNCTSIEDRVEPSAARAVSSYVEFGRRLITVNGQNTPRKLSPWPCEATGATVFLKQLGWSAACPPPEPWEVDVGPGSAPTSHQIGVWAGGTGSYTDIEMSSEVGLGSRTDDTKNSYIWWCTFINEDGSESPISAPSKRITWTTPSSGDWNSYRFCVGMNLPIGPAGTVARRVYRTINLENMNIEDVVGYFVDEIPNNIEDWYVDSKADRSLGVEAPSTADSIVFPSYSARFACTFRGRLFIDGGPSNENVIYWSEVGLMDTYAADGFAVLSSKSCGSVTGWLPTENMVIILRERGVEVIIPTPDGSFGARPYLSNIGSAAGGTLTNIPGVGAVFLAKDGVYRLSGARDGGGTMAADRISDQIQDVFDRLNPAVLARATAAYSHKWNEWHCYFAIDGSHIPNIGIVYHLDNGQWSVREGFPVGCITSTFNGELVFGHNLGDVGNQPEETGLFVISRRRAAGQTRENQGTEEQPLWVIVDNEPPTSTFRSAWMSPFGDVGQAAVNSVTIAGQVMGNNTVDVKFYVDDEPVVSESAALIPQAANKAKRPVYDSIKLGSAYVEDKAPTWVADPIVTAYRLDTKRFAAERFMFEVVTTNDFNIRGFSVDYSAANAQPQARK